MPPLSAHTRFCLENRLANHPNSYLQNGHDIIQGLRQSPKTLPPHYFYDDRGSLLFEQICLLPEYYPTRTEAQILQKIAPEIAALTCACDVIELGSGSSTKTRILLSAYASEGLQLRYLPIDVSEAILTENAQAILVDYPTFSVLGLVSTYQLALSELPQPQFPRRLMAFLGSSLGNFLPDQCQQFFQQVASALNPGDYFLLGVDLVKPKDILEAAYNDTQGVTAAFNLNILHHLNWRFGGNFVLEQFTHHACFNAELFQIEMYLQSMMSQTASLDNIGLTVDFAAGERILTEVSRKFTLTGEDAITTQLSRHHLNPQQVWTDDNNWFALILCRR